MLGIFANVIRTATSMDKTAAPKAAEHVFQRRYAAPQQKPANDSAAPSRAAPERTAARG